MSRRAVVIVLARAGSKGLPRKNALPVAGRPCAAWTLAAAKNATSAASVALSSDDPELLALAGAMSVTPIRRPPELASDTATVDAAARHALADLGTTRTLNAPDLPIVILYANVPVRPVDLIDRAVQLLVESGCDSVQSYAPVGKHHPWWTVRVEEPSGKLRPWEGEVLYNGVYRRQDLAPAFIPDGGVLAVTRRALMCEIPGVTPGPHAFLGLDKRGVVNPEGSVVDIDSRVDLLVADAMLRESSKH